MRLFHTISPKRKRALRKATEVLTSNIRLQLRLFGKSDIRVAAKDHLLLELREHTLACAG